ncbi:MAG: transglycosylase domain-containing protein [Bifidobacteriaceae bacterium]|nr:transglycosylase domain-containing protein [Bifidobacteriaceae bacterium]
MASIAGFLVISVGCGVLGSALFIPAIAVTTVAAETGTTVLEAVPAEVQLPDTWERSDIYASDGTTLLATFYDQNRVLVGIEDISQPMRDAVVALEDRRFYTHSGVDVQGMMRAFINNAIGQEGMQGASTLTQQFIKNSLIQQAQEKGDTAAADAAVEFSYARKLREAKMAVELEKQYSKDQILEWYLNIAQFGPSLYGVEAAANYYFGVKAKDLTVVQAATIAAVTQTPNGLDPENFAERNKVRRDDALSAMLRDAYITKEQYDEAVATDVTASLNITKTQSSCQAADKFSGSGFFCDYVLEEIRNSPAFGKTETERTALLQRGGLRIVTTIDLSMQAAAKEAIEDNIPTGDPSGVAQALSSVEPGTGKIRAMAQNRDYRLEGTPDNTYTAINYNADLAYGGSRGFQPGSTFKPFTLAAWLNAGHALREPFDGSKQRYTKESWNAKCIEGGTMMISLWNVKGGARNPNTALAATTGSMNASYAAMEKKLDLCDIRDLAASMGVTRADDKEWDFYPSQVLGTNVVAPLAMAGAYATFASGGIFCRPTALESVATRDGEEIPLPEDRCERALSEGVANSVSYALQTVIAGGTGTKARLAGGRPAAGKTGTTDDSEAAWFCGYTPQLATAIWAGTPAKPTELKGTIGGKPFRAGAFGGDLSAPVFKAFMDVALDGQEKRGFPAPPNSLLNGKQVRVPSVLGMDANTAKQQLEAEDFTVKFNSQKVFSDNYPANTVAQQSPSGSAYPGGTITLTLSDGPQQQPFPPFPPFPPNDGQSH